MSILSIVAVGRLAERHVRRHGPQSAEALIHHLIDLDVARDRAEAGLRLAITCGRLEPATDNEGAATVAIPSTTEAAA